MVEESQKKYKITIKILLAVIFILGIYILYYHNFVCIYGLPSVNKEVYKEDDFIYKKIGNSYKVKQPMNKIEIITTWKGKPITSDFFVYDKDFNLIGENNTNNFALSGDFGKVYIKEVYSANFIEGGKEIRYTWFLVELDSDSKDTITFPVDLNPALWVEEPDIEW